MKNCSIVIIIEIFFTSPLLTIVAVFCDCNSEEGEKTDVPMIDYACDINVSPDILRMVSDKVAGKYATH